MSSLSEDIEGLFQSSPAAVQIDLCLWIFSITVRVQLVSSSTEELGGHDFRHFGEQTGRKVRG